MTSALIAWCLRNRFLILIFYLTVTFVGVWSMFRTPIDAIPDLSENQVIVFTEWTGLSAFHGAARPRWR
jgi:Cu(I)/Ag(I) efflux system membrane protein CusA/SilA